MAGVLKLNKMVKNMKVNGFKIKKKVKVNMLGQMEKKQKECGKMINIKDMLKWNLMMKNNKNQQKK